MFQVNDEAPCSERIAFVELRQAFWKAVSSVKVVDVEEMERVSRLLYAAWMAAWSTCFAEVVRKTIGSDSTR